MRLRCVTEVTFRDRRSTLCALDVWTRKDSWPAQDFVRVLRCGSGIFVAGAGNREVAMCDGGDISWQAQYFVRVRRVDAERFVAGAGNREVVSCGRGECRCHIGIGV